MKSVMAKATILMSILLLGMSMILTNPVNAAKSDPKVLIDLSHGNAHGTLGELSAFVSDLTAWGFSVVLASGGINATILTGVDVFVQSMPGTNFTSAEKTALTNWFAAGNKAVWLATDSDFTTAAAVPGPIYQNALLETLGSKLRFEPSSLESPDVNIEAAYRVLAPIFNRAPGLAYNLTTNVRMGFFHGPAILCGWNGTAYVALETAAPGNVTWIAKTSGSSVLVETDPTYLAYAHAEGQKGPFVIMAAEALGTNKIVLSGEAIFTTYKDMYHYPGERNYPQDDMILVKNVFSWFAVNMINATRLTVSSIPASVGDGATVTFTGTYTTSGVLIENLTTKVPSIPVQNALVTVLIDTTSRTATATTTPGVYTATWTATLPFAFFTLSGKFTWKVTATRAGHQAKTIQGSIEVTRQPWVEVGVAAVLIIVIVAAVVLWMRRGR